MILKKQDSRNCEIDELKRLSSIANLTSQQKFDIERELKQIQAGQKGEEDSAYYLNFNYRFSENIIVIHDLRLEYLGEVAQIDHLLINRLLHFYVIETKSFFYGIKITESGEFMVWDGKTYHGIPSPIEQNARHISLLKKVLEKNDLSPKRLGITLLPTFNNYVLISPKSRITRPAKSQFDSEHVIAADNFISSYNKEIDKMDAATTLTSLLKIISTDTLLDIGKKLVKLHKKSGKINYATKFGVPEIKKNDATKSICNDCGKQLTEKAIAFCMSNVKRYGGKIYCYNCQKSHQ